MKHFDLQDSRKKFVMFQRTTEDKTVTENGPLVDMLQVIYTA